MATLFIITGLPASGKTTLANKIIKERKALLLSEDEWMEKICNSYYNEEVKERIVNFQFEFAVKILKAGINVVMDGGYWSKEERDMLRNLAKKASADFKLFYTKASLEELKARALKRNETLAKEFQMKIEDLEFAYNKFQEPTFEEEFILITK